MPQGESISRSEGRQVAGLLNIGYISSYCAGAAGAGFVAGAGSAGFEASGEAGFIVSLAGGLVLWVVVLSVPLSLQAATPKRAIAEIDARMSFFITSLLRKRSRFGERSDKKCASEARVS